MSLDQAKAAFLRAINEENLRKAIFSRPTRPDIVRAEIRPYAARGQSYLQRAEYHTDGKVYHENHPAEAAAPALFADFGDKYRQANVFTDAAELQIQITARGDWNVRRAAHKQPRPPAAPAAHDAPRNYILPEGTPVPFLCALGVMDARGRVNDRMRDKFRQVNRYLECIGDVAGALPDRPLRVVDLCCGKSYLTFAAHYYLTRVLGREVTLTGIDRKRDVIEACDALARELSLEGLTFIAGDIETAAPQGDVDMAISLHACDIATDVALAYAVHAGARVILAAPCCQHELAGQLRCDELGAMTDYPLLRHRLADLATDALRARLLAVCGYQVQALEFIESQHTPKNLMLRAVREPIDAARAQALLADYRRTCALLNVQPALERLLRL